MSNGSEASSRSAGAPWSAGLRILDWISLEILSFVLNLNKSHLETFLSIKILFVDNLLAVKITRTWRVLGKRAFQNGWYYKFHARILLNCIGLPSQQPYHVGCTSFHSNIATWFIEPGRFWMWDHFGTPGAAGIGFDTSAAYGRVDSVESEPPHWWNNGVLVSISGRASPDTTCREQKCIFPFR